MSMNYYNINLINEMIRYVQNGGSIYAISNNYYMKSHILSGTIVEIYDTSLETVNVNVEVTFSDKTCIITLIGIYRSDLHRGDLVEFLAVPSLSGDSISYRTLFGIKVLNSKSDFAFAISTLPYRAIEINVIEKMDENNFTEYFDVRRFRDDIVAIKPKEGKDAIKFMASDTKILPYYARYDEDEEQKRKPSVPSAERDFEKNCHKVYFNTDVNPQIRKTNVILCQSDKIFAGENAKEYRDAQNKRLIELKDRLGIKGNIRYFKKKRVE